MPAPTTRAPYDLDAIVDIAVRTFLEHGYDGTSMDRLAQAAGIRKPSLYYHVSGKEELLRLGVTRALDASYAVFDEPGAATGDALTRLRFVVRRECEAIAEHVPETALMIRARGNTDTERWVLQQRRALNRKVQRFVQDAVDAGFLAASLDARTATRLMLGTITSVVDWYRVGGQVSPADLAQQAELVLFGLASPAEAHPS